MIDGLQQKGVSTELGTSIIYTHIKAALSQDSGKTSPTENVYIPLGNRLGNEEIVLHQSVFGTVKEFKVRKAKNLNAS